MEGCTLMNCVVEQKKKSDKKNDELSCNSILGGMSILVPQIHVNVEIHCNGMRANLIPWLGSVAFI